MPKQKLQLHFKMGFGVFPALPPAFPSFPLCLPPPHPAAAAPRASFRSPRGARSCSVRSWAPSAAVFHVTTELRSAKGDPRGHGSKALRAAAARSRQGCIPWARVYGCFVFLSHSAECHSHRPGSKEPRTGIKYLLLHTTLPSGNYLWEANRNGKVYFFIYPS